MTQETLTVALWSTNLAHPVSSMEDWVKLVDAQMQAAKAQGAEVLLMPEFSCEHWMHVEKTLPKPTEQIAWMAERVPAALPPLSALAKKHEMLLAAGTFASSLPGANPPFSNRAHVFFPDGRVLTQDKLCLTPKEKNPDGWNLSTGSEIKPFMFKGFKIAVFICLDIELPALSARIASEHIDLVLVPSMTKKLAGYYRVYDCAKARAVELQAAIGVCGAIAGAPGRDANVSGAAFYLPCEEAFGHTGTLASVPPAYAAKDAGPLLVATLPLGAIRAMRRGGAEVWPGAWSPAHVKVTEFN